MKIWEDERQCYIRAVMEKNSEAENEALKAQLDAIDWSVLEQIERKETVNERGVFAPLEAVETEEIERRRDEFRELGIKAIREGKVGAVLLAGGQGTRLGLDRPKGTLNIGIHRELFLFQQLIRNLMDVTDEAGAYVPLYIMTSNINHDDTQAFFEEHGYFGYPKEYVKFFVQEMEPACDYQGRVYMESSTRVAMSPNGNGGWFGSMVNAGLLSDIRSHGIEWINVFAVDNCLQRIADPLFIGATIAYGCESGAKVVRKAGGTLYRGRQAVDRGVLRDDGRDGDCTESKRRPALWIWCDSELRFLREASGGDCRCTYADPCGREEDSVYGRVRQSGEAGCTERIQVRDACSGYGAHDGGLRSLRGRQKAGVCADQESARRGFTRQRPRAHAGLRHRIVT